jgi:tRNA (guanine37-N1)-methyltransferase
MSYTVSIITLFPDMFPGALGHSILARAAAKGAWNLKIIDIRGHSLPNNHKTVDDTPYGGGAGMVMRPDVIAAAIQAAKAENPTAPVYFMSPAGTPFTTAKAKDLAKGEGVILLCGHYEGIDQRVLDKYVDGEISIGDFVLTGGEIPAMAVVDAIIRQLPGVLGNAEGLHEESFENNLLEYPHYTRPEVFEGVSVPEVLKSGNHAKIDAWRQEQALERTKARRPDLLKK